MSPQAIRVFEKLSGWTERSEFEQANDGRVQIHEDIKTGAARAHFSPNNFDSVSGPLIGRSLQYMHLNGVTFVR